MAEKKDRLTELLSDEGFMKNLFSQETPEKAQKILKANGVDMPVEEVFIMGKTVLYIGEHDGELPDEFAEQVAGGALDSYYKQPDFITGKKSSSSSSSGTSSSDDDE